MKRLFIATCLTLLTLQSSAQEVYNKLYESAQTTINNPEASDSQVKLNHFYVTELNYLKNKATQEMETVTTTFLDTQAYYLSEFVGSFFKDLSAANRISIECQRNVAIAYVNATLSNPLFNDADKEKVHSFVNDPQYLTPFSLDTDWEKAYKEVKEKVAELIK